MKNNKMLLWALGIVLLTVWGNIGYQLMSAVSTSENSDSTTENGININKSVIERGPYRTDVSDPFEYSKPVRRTKVKKVVPVVLVAPCAPPPFKLTGIVIDENKKAAVLEGNDGTVSFLEEGDSLGGVHVITILGKQVTYVYLNQKNIWNLGD